jgi:putative Holliday junction resolvase
MLKRIAALGIDVGRKRMGIAGCDGLGLLATGLTTIIRSSFARDVAELKQIVMEREVEILVVGLPYSMNGELGPQAKEVQKFASRISQALNLPIEYVDERLTSVEAENILKSQKKYSSRHKELVDRQAAAIILQQWLDRRSLSDKVN